MDFSGIVTLVLVAVIILALVLHFREQSKAAASEGRFHRLGTWGSVGLVSCGLLLIWVAIKAFVIK